MQEAGDQYHLARELAKKYSHSTYLASPTDAPHHQVVLTMFASSLFHSSHERENLLQKAHHIKKLQHSHLMPTFDIGVKQKQPFVVHEYQPKGSLRNHLKNTASKRLELKRALSIVLQVGEALTYAHKYNIVHGNIKPENILLDANGEVLLTDFHLVSRKDSILRDQVAGEYAFCYLAPEQLAGTCDTRSDQYALGCLTYELIAGRAPFASSTLASMMENSYNMVPAALSETIPDLPLSLDTVVLKALAQDPTERFLDFSLFLEAIQSVLSPPPAFPLLRSAHSRKHETTSHLAQSTEVESPLSPVHRHTAKPTAPEPSQASEVSSNVEVERAELEGILPMSNANTESIPLPEDPASLPGETNPIGNRANEEKARTPLATDPFMEGHSLGSIVVGTCWE